MKFFFIAMLCACASLQVFSQNTKIKITEKTVVQDSDGMVYPYMVWSSLMRKGDYTLKPVDPQDSKTAFIIIKLTEQQKSEMMAKMAKPRESDYFKTGREISLFKTTDLNRHKIDLKAEKGKVIVLNFWFINCPPCRMEIPDLNEMVQSYKGNDSVRFIGIALDGSYDLKEFLTSFPFNYQIIDSGRSLAERYGIRSFPTHVIIDQEGKVYFHTSGLGTNTVYWIKKSINELLSQPAVAKQ